MLYYKNKIKWTVNLFPITSSINRFPKIQNKNTCPNAYVKYPMVLNAKTFIPSIFVAWYASKVKLIVVVNICNNNATPYVSPIAVTKLYVFDIHYVERKIKTKSINLNLFF